MKVLILMPSRFFGGPEIQTLQAIAELKARHSIDFIVAVFPAGNTKTAQNPMVLRAEQAGFEALEFVHSFNYDLIGAHLKVRELVRRANPDVVCSMGYKANLITAGLRELPTLAVVHGWTGAPNSVRFFEALDRGTLRFHRAVGYVSPSQKEPILKLGVPEDRLFWLTNALDLRALPPPADRAKLRESLGLKADTSLLGSVGRLSSEKAQRFLIEAFAQIKDQRRDLHLVLVGDGPEDGRLKAQAERLGVKSRTHFLGLRPDGGRIVGALDVVALPSLTEAMPVVALEACAYKIPMVASRVGALPEILLDGEAGWLVAPGDVTALARSITEALADSGRKAARSFQNLADRFTIDQQIDAWLAALKRSLED